MKIRCIMPKNFLSNVNSKPREYCWRKTPYREFLAHPPLCSWLTRNEIRGSISFMTFTLHCALNRISILAHKYNKLCDGLTLIHYALFYINIHLHYAQNWITNSMNIMVERSGKLRESYGKQWQFVSFQHHILLLPNLYLYRKSYTQITLVFFCYKEDDKIHSIGIKCG